MEEKSKGVNAMDSAQVAKNDEPIVSAPESVKWGTDQLPVVNAPDPLKNAITGK
jgi:hypothetical protein